MLQWNARLFAVLALVVLVASFVGGFTVTGFWPAVGGAIVYGILSWALSALVLGTQKPQ